MKNLPARINNRVTGMCMRALVGSARLREDRGDVPGWVLISVMTAGLTTAVWLIADEQLTGILDRAMTSVSMP